MNEPWSRLSNCPGFGCADDCELTHGCEHHADCVKSLQDTIENYCPHCGKLNYECDCTDVAAGEG